MQMPLSAILIGSRRYFGRQHHHRIFQLVECCMSLDQTVSVTTWSNSCHMLSWVVIIFHVVVVRHTLPRRAVLLS